LALAISAVSAASVYESNWHLQANADAVSAQTARLSRLHFVNKATEASVRFHDKALCVSTQNTNLEIDVAQTPPQGSVAMRLRLKDLYVYELFLIGGPWSLNIFRFRYGNEGEPRRVGVFPPLFTVTTGFYGQQVDPVNWVRPLNGENTTLPSRQELLWVVFTWSTQTSAVWWNLDGKFNSNSTALLHSGSGNDFSNTVTLYFRHLTTACIEALVIGDSIIADPQRALMELDEKTGTRAVMTTMEATMSTASASTTSTSTSLSTASTTLKTDATALRTLAPRESLDGGTLGAVIGGCIAGMLVIAGVVFLACRSRRQPPAPKEKKDANAIYGALELGPKAPDYGHGNID
jgi:hypothetical protein